MCCLVTGGNGSCIALPVGVVTSDAAASCSTLMADAKTTVNGVQGKWVASACVECMTPSRAVMESSPY